MEDSTLRPTPSYNPNIPVVTAAGGTNVAYKDPNSPEGILKRVTELNAQTTVDTKYDAAASPYTEGFYGCPCSHHHLQLLLGITIVLFITLVSMNTLRMSGKLFLMTCCVLLLIASLRIYHHAS